MKNLTAVLLLSALVLSLCSFNSRASTEEQNSAQAIEIEESRTRYVNTYLVRQEKSLDYLRTKNLSAYKSASLTYNGRRINVSSRVINGVIYVSLSELVDSLTDMNVSYNNSSKTLYVNGYGLNLSVSDGAYAVYANGRVLFCMTPSAVMSDGNMYTPLSSVAEALGLKSAENPSQRSAALSGSVRAITSGAVYYREDEVYWLARIISAESRGESLIGQIAVGNVVLNRVRSSLFPNTIWGVIFDKKYGVQFSPVANGTIYNTPSQSSITAAKICLDGFSLSEDILYFLRPSLSTSSWIPRTRKYVFTVGNHDFYA